MLKFLGLGSLDELVRKTVPSDILLKEPLALSPAMSETEYLARLKEMASKNKNFRSMIGMGFYGSAVLPVITRNIFENPVWYTSYTPYQAEISQGRLEALLNFQTVIMDLTGFNLTNCSLLDDATAAAEAMRMMYEVRTRDAVKAGKNVVFVAHRDTRKEGDDTVFIPALREKSYNSIVTELDLLGYLEMRNENGVQRRTITFDPTSRNDGKNTCNLPGIMFVPNILDKNGNPTAKNDFITTQVISPYLGMLQVKKEEAAKYDKVIAEIKENIELITDARSANDFALRINEFEHIGSSLAKARDLFGKKVKELGLVYDKESKTYADHAA